ncbi:larval cuticle protein LCP-14 isoform X1 [Hyalella azteca]|uniref:Larval cuticle protein LCP-14 isoform X1 n=1 Tax=Hyalella azteca TaxID=294128 RepID=A0A979FRW6_HYAAZ|nr:larval cuticle protein LCP-14 isoform X1 [Hyalella azteca]
MSVRAVSVRNPLLVLVCWCACAASLGLHDPNGDGHVAILLDQRQHPEKDGSFGFRFETENGIRTRMAGRNGANGGTIMSGEYSYKQTDGSTVHVRWTADENGYRPVVTITGGSAEKVVRKRSHPVTPTLHTSRVTSRGRRQRLLSRR